MPANIPDLAWYASTGVIVLLLSILGVILGWGFTILVKKFDELGMKLEKWIDHVIALERRIDAMSARCDERHR